MTTNILKAVIDRGIPHNNHYFDLYVEVNEETTELVSQYRFKNDVTVFTDQITGKRTYDIPFAYYLYREE